MITIVLKAAFLFTTVGTPDLPGIRNVHDSPSSIVDKTLGIIYYIANSNRFVHETNDDNEHPRPFKERVPTAVHKNAAFNLSKLIVVLN